VPLQVSNFGAKHIQEFIDQKVPLPTVNQIDLHPFMRHPEIVRICEDNGILLEVSVIRCLEPELRYGCEDIFLRWPCLVTAGG
jgi:hypothetical protein